MPYRTLDLAAAADYLHVTRSELEQLVKTTEIPHQDRGGRLVFFRGEIDAWASQRILGLPPKRLAAYHQKSTQGTRPVFSQEALLPELLQSNFITATMLSKTKKSVIRDLVAMAEATGRVMDPAGLVASIEERESLCSTGLPGGIALLHCRNHQPYRFEDSFIVLGRTMQEIHFGAPDGRPTWLFFLICCQDERIHLHTLARLCLIVQQTDIVAQLLAAPDATTMYAALLAAEQTALTDKKRPSNQAATA
jgi:mannitol/fructose-specific phosphotransferase system IIA component (Ntr-type)/predicted DNA-binding transcriptional regulator AlpA